MDATIFAWTIAATIAAGFHVFASKVTANKGLDSALNGVFSSGVAAVLATAVCIYQGVLADAWALVAMWALFDGLAYALGSIARIDALRYIDATIFFPISKIIGPLFVVIGGVALLHEQLAYTQWLGIVIALGTPLLLIEHREHVRQKNLYKGLVLCLVSTFFSSIIALIVKEGVAPDHSFWLFMAVANFAAAVVSLGIYMQKHNFVRSRMVLTRHDLEVGMGVGVLGFISCFTMFSALQHGYVSLVYPIHAHYILIPIFLSVWWYGEHMNLRKFAAVVLSCVTLTLLY